MVRYLQYTQSCILTVNVVTNLSWDYTRRTKVLCNKFFYAEPNALKFTMSAILAYKVYYKVLVKVSLLFALTVGLRFVTSSIFYQPVGQFLLMIIISGGLIVEVGATLVAFVALRRFSFCSSEQLFAVVFVFFLALTP